MARGTFAFSPCENKECLCISGSPPDASDIFIKGLGLIPDKRCSDGSI